MSADDKDDEKLIQQMKSFPEPPGGLPDTLQDKKKDGATMRLFSRKSAEAESDKADIDIKYPAERNKSEAIKEWKDFDVLFKSYSKFGDRNSDGHICLQNVLKWMRDGGVFKDRSLNISERDVEDSFNKMTKGRYRASREEFKVLIGNLAQEKGKFEPEIVEKLMYADRARPRTCMDFVRQIFGWKVRTPWQRKGKTKEWDKVKDK